jgi:hypothetical protein
MRGPAFWRGGDGFNVSLDDGRGVWHDFTTDEGGGVLDLVVRVRGGNRADALRWLADLTGVALSDKPLSAEGRERWIRERRAFERNLPMARYWRRAVLVLAGELLDTLKVGLVGANSTTTVTTTTLMPEPGELMHLTAMVARLKGIDGTALVDEYKAWVRHHPQFTKGMVRAARNLEATELSMLHRYVGMTESVEAA